MNSVDLLPFPKPRRHTEYFSTAMAGRPLVHLGTEADVSGLLDRSGRRPAASATAHVIRAIAETVAQHPDANCTFHRLPFPMLSRPRDVSVKVAFDVEVDGVRTVQSDVLMRADRRTPSEIHEWMQHTRSRMQNGRGRTRLLSALPRSVGRSVFASMTIAPVRHRFLGTIAVTSLAHRRVGTFFSDGGTTVTVGVGHAHRRPTVQDDSIEIRSVLPLSMTFDHRVIDGALAADILGDLVRHLERCTVPASHTRSEV
ncbi:hypothetical protein A5767_16855 [Rhodococcus sp. 852002-51564_SCH6189132-a]|nr:hypothetical protein A5767_16855 [Rhodococcus sp. 852002-51564_SCH6189132-a]